ncbi:MAG TPA: GGDEF domain-containing phosphodiesterase [Rhodanobacteraceae bacterium]|nr:GGDEF domain-containing phosphodiesterase [Rhodanobacteraceae bacterium]
MLNREALFDALQRHIAVCGEGGQHLGLLFLRARRLREFTLEFGYARGEAAAAGIEELIRGSLRAGDELLRIGECDFAALLPRLRNRQQAALAAAKLVRTLQRRQDDAEQDLRTSIVIGGAVCPDDGSDAEQLCRRADSACDVAARGTDGYALDHADAHPDAPPRDDLDHAIRGNQLELYLQPIVDLRGGSGERFEALSRWTHPQLGVIPPDRFIPAAERNGLIGDLTRWNINSALRHVALARDAGRAPGISLNLSTMVLHQQGLAEQLVDLAHFWNVACESIVFELTETSLMDDPVRCIGVLEQLRECAFGIAIDDFGTGYSSMAYLKQVPATELKIDKSFVSGMREDPRTVRLVASMLELAHEYGMKAVAEGVEDAATLALLRDAGCDFAQGHYLGIPRPASEALELANVAQQVR